MVSRSRRGFYFTALGYNTIVPQLVAMAMPENTPAIEGLLHLLYNLHATSTYWLLTRRAQSLRRIWEARRT